jgi:protein farnesyltransferase subunit beta
MLSYVYRSDPNCKSYEEWDGNTLFNPIPFQQIDLQKYLLVCCQDSQSGGFRDKPPMRKDVYHTFYSLAGLSIAQHCQDRDKGVADVIGDEQNMLAEINPLHGVEVVRLREAKEYFSKLPQPSLG